MNALKEHFMIILYNMPTRQGLFYQNYFLKRIFEPLPYEYSMLVINIIFIFDVVYPLYMNGISQAGHF